MKKILIIEDETLIALSLKKLLTKRGHNVITIESGLEAINLLKRDSFDRVICDLILPDISGFDIIEEARTHLGEDKIKLDFVIMTAYNSSQVLEKAREYGCEILSKPFEDLSLALSIIEGARFERI